MKFKSNHVAFTVNNIDESIKWYSEKLGFTVVFRYNKHDMKIAILKLGEVRIELFCFNKNTKALPDYRKDLMNDLHVIGTKHLCIEVDNLDQAIKTFKTRGIIFTREIDAAAFGGRYIFFKDCNDILIELYQA
jgi:catechol 2,3-dioxygenase-like lactoylglutathione lyase family enzyme